ncbi:MAG: endonuclease domain-containing protein [Alphaproteobacteria bacterium PRO2]|nr:endonuclease domain-containing protein [Alphaproteobacteria bacterium PRO2]
MDDDNPKRFHAFARRSHDRPRLNIPPPGGRGLGGGVKVNVVLKKFSRDLRNNPTDAEKILWRCLKRKQLHGLKFRRQKPIDNFIADFVCLEKRLIIELDGGQHNDNLQDRHRTEILESNGFLVLRFWNNEIFENIEGVLETIMNTVNPHPHPPPQGEGVLKDSSLREGES